jgi:uncharacterized protein
MKIRQLDVDSPLSREHEELGLPPLEVAVTHPEAEVVRQDQRLTWLVWSLALATFALLAWLMPWQPVVRELGLGPLLRDPFFWQAMLVGLVAQTIDGALGMAYGISATTFLLSVGVTPAAASASVHMAEVATTAVSGLAHWRMGNVDRQLFRRLLIPGLIGAVSGAWFVTRVDGDLIRPWIAAYLLLMGIYILTKAARRRIVHREVSRRRIGSLALTGGFVDAVGGGGWGPVVTSSLLGSGHVPRTTIGSVNAAEFFLAIAGAASFTVFVGLEHWNVILGLVIGGLFAAPIAAVLCRRLPARALMLLVGTLVSGLSLFNLVRWIGTT